MSLANRLLSPVFQFLGYRVTRLTPRNRFQAMDDSLGLMKSAGYSPRAVIDGGANRGQFARLVRSIFPDALVHLVEPQSDCAPDLVSLAAGAPDLYRFHRFALSSPGNDSVRMIGGGRSGGTGNYVAFPGETDGDELVAPATTLDRLFPDGFAKGDRAFLKLDVEGHELEVLKGAETLLPRLEVLLLEVQFYEIERNGRPTFADVFLYLRERGFELWDIACLSPRPRDQRLRMGDVVFIACDSPLFNEAAWA